MKTSNAQLDTNYIYTGNNKVSLGLKLGGIQSSFNLRNKNVNYNLSSNFVPSVGVWFKYKKLPALAISIPITSMNSDTLAKTSGIRISLKGQIAKGFIMDGYIYLLRGFNLRTPSSKYIPFPKTTNLNISLELYYILNYKKFSYKSAYLFGEIQKKNKGSFAAGISTGYFSFLNNQTFFNTTDTNTSLLDYRSISALSFSILGGYLHTIVFGKQKRWFANGAAFIGPNIHLGSTEYFKEKEKNNIANIGLNLKLKLAFGYHLPKWSFGLTGHGNIVSYKPSTNTDLTNNVVDVKLSGIYKF